MNKYNRIFTLVLDSVGIGQLPDAKEYGDFGVNTLGNISEQEGLDIPNLQKLGLGNINYIKTVDPVENPQACYCKMAEVADGKDTMTGHWEMMGCILEKGFTQYVKEGFPSELVEEFENRTGRKVLANKEANGMKVIGEYYDEHVKTGSFILYTSVDSTFQLAAHEEIIPLEELYQACEIARELTMDPKYNVARVIARPFIGKKDEVVRTSNRHDYALNPFNETTLDKLKENNLDSISVGKINDIFNGYGITKSVSIKSNQDGVDHTIKLMNDENIHGHVFINLVEFDSVFGHPRDVKGYKNCLEEFDARVPELIASLKEDDLLLITADHGNDPTYKGNDHTREYVPLLIYNENLKGKQILNRKSFSDIGATICENFDIEDSTVGNSFLSEILGG